MFVSPPVPDEVTASRRRRASPAADAPAAGTPFAEVLARNITTLVQVRRAGEARKGTQERIADAITRFSGSMAFVYLHLALFGLWIAANLGWLPGVPRFDRSFVILAMFASVEAIFFVNVRAHQPEPDDGRVRQAGRT